MRTKMLLLFMLGLHLSILTWAQIRSISGKVTDATTNLPLVGANITIAGTTVGTTSNNDGAFQLNVPANAKSFTVSILNYSTISVDITGAGPYTVEMTAATESLDDVIVVGYGKQKKRDITGAVSTISGADVSGRQTAQISEALQGAIAGVTVTRSNAGPGNGSNILIRGITTLNTNAPLIIVDGVPVGNIDLVNPNDIESLSVLKDAASAAIYGSRGAAGVILITTKRAKAGATSLDYNYEYGTQQATAMPTYASVQDYYRTFNEMKTNDGGTQFYPDAFVNSYLDSNRANPDMFPISDWSAGLLKKNAPRQRHDIVFTAGNEKIRTKASLGYQDIGAFYEYNTYKRYQFRINNDIQISRKFSSAIDVFYRQASTVDPSNNPIYESRVMPAWYDDYYDDGRFAPGKDGRNPIAQLQQGGNTKGIFNQLSGRMSLVFKPVDGLSLSAMVAPVFNWDKSKRFDKPIEFYDKNDPSRVVARNSTPRAYLAESRTESMTINGNFIANFVKEFSGEHTLDLMAGYEEIYSKTESLSAARTGFSLLDFPYLNAGSTEIMESYGDAFDNGLQSLFGRLQYNFRNKYYVQGNIRNDKSSRFAKQYRDAFFPSVSAGWTISEEGFMQNLGWLNFLKIRGSWGEAGNERIGNYPYQALLSFTNALFLQGANVVPLNGAGQQVYAVEDISWETTSTANIGMDAAFLRNRLTLSAEYFKKTTTDILLSLDIPLYIGYDRPNQNAGTLYVKGWELETGWKDKIGKFNYSVSFNIADAKSRIGDLKGTQFLGDQVIKEGSEFNEWFGYRTNGLFQNQEDLTGAAVANANTRLGDVRFIDVSGPDGKPDGKITPDDKVLLGGALPRYNYGGNLRASWLGFDFGLAFQGVGKKLSRMNSEVIRPFAEAFGNVPQNLLGNYWSKNNTAEQNMNALYPRLSDVMGNTNHQLSDFWLMNGTYFRLKNITLGYTLPVDLLKRAGVQTLRFYVAGNDLFSISDFPKYIDPEVGNASYPIVRTLMVGASIRL